MPHTDARDHFAALTKGADRYALLAGPFTTYTAALEILERAHAEACKIDAWAHHYERGVVVMPAGSGYVGKLNEQLGVKL